MKNPVDFNGGRSALELVNWVKKRTGPPSQTLSSEEELADLLSKN